MSVETAGGLGRTNFWRPLDLAASVLRFVRAMLGDRRVVNELDGLSDHHLRDIGIDRRQVAELVNRETTRDFLIESGWPPVRQSRHR